MTVYFDCRFCHKGILIESLKEHEYNCPARPKPITIEISPGNNVQYYSAHAQSLAFSQQNKIEKFLKAECLRYIGGGVFIMDPLPNYNKTTYRISKNEFGEFECTCQNSTNENRLCSHIATLYEAFKRHYEFKQKKLVIT